MTTPTETSYGEWPSPITSEMIASSGVEFAGVALENESSWWLERRPAEEGRGVIVRQTANGKTDITPPEYNVRTLVHEYGGGDFVVHEDTVWFANLDDQRLYRQQPDDDPEPITPVPETERGDRYADMEITPDGEYLYSVRERHTESENENEEPTNELVRIPVDGASDPIVVASGHDFYSYPRIHPDGDRLAWTTWDHPSMPWDESTLHVATIEDDGTLSDSQSIFTTDESVFQPAWSPDGDLHAVSDRTGWWNIYRIEKGEPVELYPAEAEFGVPQWSFGQSTYAFFDDGRIATIFGEQSTYRLGLLDPATGDLDVIDLSDDFFPTTPLASDGEHLLFEAASPIRPPSLVRWRPGEKAVVLDQATEFDLDQTYISEPEHISYPTSNDETAHALYYPPQNPDVEAPTDELPPLVVLCHGGPTSETLPALSISAHHGKPPIQFFTTRGIAVVDVNYRGSTGYGRDYRERLDGEWGVVDTIDCVNAAEYLTDQGLVDGERLAIQGGSAGGYATLCALTFHDTFDVGVSYYGVADLEALASDTHKFESRYLDGLVGPLPETQETYRERSPVHHADRIRCPLLLLQGDEDPVVPPSQAEQMLDALAENGVPHAYVEFEGEQHGFRRSESIQRAAETELSFYGRMFDFTPAENIESVEVVQPN